MPRRAFESADVPDPPLNDRRRVPNLSAPSAIAQEVHIQTALIETVNMFTALASAKGLDYRVTVDSSVPATVRTDAMRLQQILGNLLGSSV